ncbi:hypothetical protein [Hyphomicrobium sp.]|uniref:hypothetical protein n=1 Tax=Hyphomicrobium sp. TaxID=82 RepID=UPI002D76F4AD|nr:hypothetical protein [Hyphomicrobium sp.]HET6389872.1 hypothetical protein [Hyphomicrobium sp.]
MPDLIRHPTVFLAACGALSAWLGLQFNDGNYGEAPQPGLYMVLTGVWFGLALGVGLWRFGHVSPAGVIMVMLVTWIAWEAAVNVAIQIDGPLLAAAGPSLIKSCLAGFVAGAVGAAITWAGAAAFVPSLRRPVAVSSIVMAGALLGVLLPATNYFDGGAVLLVAWQTAVAGLIGLNMLGSERPRSRVTLAAGG